MTHDGQRAENGLCNIFCRHQIKGTGGPYLIENVRPWVGGILYTPKKWFKDEKDLVNFRQKFEKWFYHK